MNPGAEHTVKWVVKDQTSMAIPLAGEPALMSHDYAVLPGGREVGKYEFYGAVAVWRAKCRGMVDPVWYMLDAGGAELVLPRKEWQQQSNWYGQQGKRWELPDQPQFVIPDLEQALLPADPLLTWQTLRAELSPTLNASSRLTAFANTVETALKERLMPMGATHVRGTVDPHAAVPQTGTPAGPTPQVPAHAMATGTPSPVVALPPPGSPVLPKPQLLSPVHEKESQK
jgi:hypothetical protein